MNDDDDEYKSKIRNAVLGTGYGKPPQQHQFKKGQSGNPRGRPKTMSNDARFSDQKTLKMFLEIGEEPVQLREGTGQREISMREALARANYNKALKGDSRAQAIALTMMQKADLQRAYEIREEIAIWMYYKDEQSAAIAKAKAGGKQIPTLFPHPDDVIIDHEKGPQFVGPFTEQEQARVDHTIRMRDILILQNELDCRSDTRHTGEALTEPGGAELLAVFLERGLPPRLRLSKTGWFMKAMAAQQFTKPELLKELYQQWKGFGLNLPRGYIFPSLHAMKDLLEKFVEIANEVRRMPSPEKMPNAQWDKEAAAIICAHFST